MVLWLSSPLLTLQFELLSPDRPPQLRPESVGTTDVLELFEQRHMVGMNNEHGNALWEVVVKQSSLITLSTIAHWGIDANSS